MLGHTGFIGSAIFEKFKRDNNLIVRGLSSSEVDLEKPRHLGRLMSVLNRQTVLVVAIRSRNRDDTLQGFTSDIRMVVHLTQVLQAKAVRKCIYFSSASVYGHGETNLTVDERTPVCPMSFYAAAKVTGEFLLGKIAQERGFPLLILRPCNVYGPGDKDPQHGPARFIRSVLEGKPIALYGDGSERRDQLYVLDLGDIVHRLAFSEASGMYNLATGRSYSFREVLESLRRVIPEHFSVARIKRTRPKIDQQFNVARLCRELSRSHFTDLEEGIRETYWASTRTS